MRFGWGVVCDRALHLSLYWIHSATQCNVRITRKNMTGLTLDLNSIVTLTDEQFYQLCAQNPDVRLERTATGELVIMPPTGGETGKRNSDINLELGLWNRQSQLGVVFDSSTGFRLPNGAIRSPDAAWILQERWDALSREERRRFLPLCPDFVIELLSPTDDWQTGLAKMQEYQENGCRLGWLIDPLAQQVAIYRQEQSVEVLEKPNELLGEDVLPCFVLNLHNLLGRR